MRILVLSDVHGNCLALETVLADVKKKGFDQIICNGDMIQGGPQPHETVQLLREMKCPIVMGNSDAWLLTGEEMDADSISEERRKKLDAVREWSLSRLNEDDCAFIGAFQPTVTVDLGNGRSLLAFHGSPTSFDQVLLPSTLLRKSTKKFSNRIQIISSPVGMSICNIPAACETAKIFISTRAASVLHTTTNRPVNKNYSTPGQNMPY